jgi:hypothetical protein
MADLAQKRNIRRHEDGGSVTYRLRLANGASLTIVTHELDLHQSSRVTSEAWPAPLNASEHAAFLREALVFNRNAIHHLPCGILQDRSQTGLYRLTWYVPATAMQAQEWHQRLVLFGTLANKAWSTLPQPGRNATKHRAASDGQNVIFMP